MALIITLLIGFVLIWVGSNVWIAGGVAISLFGVVVWIRGNLLNMHAKTGEDLRTIWNSISDVANEIKIK